ncbi:MAG: 50S ribosomal protein L13 [Candidatus Baldrarchaeia archaeon]
MSGELKDYAVIDAENAIVGRLASVVAKRLLNGEKIAIVNAEKAVISGDYHNILEEYKQWLQIRTLTNPRKGPFHYRRPDKLVKRIIRGMLPWKTWRGRMAYKRLRVFIGVPEELKDVPKEKLKIADASRLRGKYITIFELSRQIGWNPPKSMAGGEN